MFELGVFWERRVGSAAYHAFRFYARHDGPRTASDRGRRATTPECRTFSRGPSEDWFVWTGEQAPGDLCPSCAMLTSVPEPKQASMSHDPICRICREPRSAHGATPEGPFTHAREARGEGGHDKARAAAGLPLSRRCP